MHLWRTYSCQSPELIGDILSVLQHVLTSYSMFSHFSTLDFSFYLWWAMSASCLYSLLPFLSTICLNYKNLYKYLVIIQDNVTVTCWTVLATCCLRCQKHDSGLEREMESFRWGNLHTRFIILRSAYPYPPDMPT